MTTTRKKQLTLLAIMTGFCILLIGIRIVFTGKITFLFLNWNLFLAFLPLLFTSLLAMGGDFASKKWTKIGVLFSWLLFFPNAPYILTDMFHLHKSSNAPMWFDLILILSYAWTGLVAGFISLYDIERTVFKGKSQRSIILISVTLIFITAFGIYLGRYPRFNSWDVFHQPGAIISEIADRFIHPMRHYRTWGVTLGLGVLLNFMYWSLRMMFAEEKSTITPSVHTFSSHMKLRNSPILN